MAIDLKNLNLAGSTFSNLPFKRQLLIMIMISISIALGVIVAMWSRDVSVAPLYANLEPVETQTVIDALKSKGIAHQYDSNQGILVDMSKVNEIRMLLASMGLPKSNGVGYELLDKNSNFGTSQFMENVRLRRSIEGELAKTIMGLDAVRSARVHLGLPRQTSFLKRKVKGSASVMVELHGNKSLTEEQVMGIVYLVSSSVSELDSEDVTVVDQRGKMLTSNKNIQQMSAAVEESNFVNRKEQEYVRKIQELLEPVLGHDSVRAEVSAYFDFTNYEETSEEYLSDKPRVRSESVTDEARQGNAPSGVPGALSNQPPSVATAPQTLDPTVVATAAQPAVDPNTGLPSGATSSTNSSVAAEPKTNYRSTRTSNYEVDRKVAHVKKGLGKLERLSVAVLLNHKITGYDKEGLPTRQALTADELQQVEALVKDAVGYDEKRGDSIRIVNQSFAVAPPIPAPLSIMQDPGQLLDKPWFMPVMKHIASALILLFLLFGILRPMLKSLADLSEDQTKKTNETGIPDALQFNLPPSDEVTKQRVDYVKELAHNDTKKAAQVVMSWVGTSDE